MRNVSRAASILCLGLVSSCGGGGGGSPTSPSTPTATGLPVGATLSFVSGETDQPVAGAAVNLGGTQYQSDASGTVRLTVAAPFRSLLDVTHPAYLDRQTLLRSSDEVRFTLWPRSNSHGLDEEFTARLVYSNFANADGPPGDTPLYRLAPNRPVALRPSAELMGDASLLALIEEGADLVNGAVGQGLFFVDTGGTAPGPVFTLELKPEDVYCTDRVYAFTDYAGRGLVIDGGKIVFCEALWYFHQRPASRDLREYFLGAIAHELGHAYGLGHSSSDRDVMSRDGHWAKYEHDHRFYSDREQLVMRLVWQRRAGTRYPDDDRAGIGSLGRFRRVILD